MDSSQNTLDKAIAWIVICIMLLIVAYGTYDVITHLTVPTFVLLLIVYIWVAIRIEEIYLKYIKK